MSVVETTRKPFATLLKEFRAGDPAAAAELLRDYTPVLRVAVRRRLPDRLRGEFESLDFVQEVWAAMCDGQAHAFQSEQQFKAYLTEVAVNRVIDAFRHRTTRRAFAGVPNKPLKDALGTEPTPSQCAMAGERWESIAATLPASHVAIVERIRDGFTQQEISNLTGISVRTISRIVQRVQRHCEETPE